MALPTAAWSGYVYFYTLGDAPNVACVHVAEWWGLFRRLCIKRGLGDIDPWQATGGDPNSGGTHTRGGAIDWGGTSRAKAMLAREAGAVAWPRAWSGNYHTHAVLDCPHNEPVAYQRVACIVYRRDGLGYRGMAGPDPLPAPSRWRTYAEGIAWMKAQLGLATTTPAPSTTTTTDEEWDMATADYISQQVKSVAELVVYVRTQVKAVAGQVSGLSAEVAELRARVDAIPADVWTQTVRRGGVDVPVLQEVADVGTIVRRIEAQP